jgi:predicted P-loop ATPase
VPSFDSDQLRRDHPLSEYLPARGIAVKPDGREFRCLCPFHAERTPSFQIYQGRKGTQEFHCKGCDAKGDVIQFVERYDGVPFAEACEILGGTREPNENRQPVAPATPAVDVYEAWTPAAPPKGTKGIRVGERTPPLENPKRGTVTHYTPTAVYRYNDAAGRFLAYVLRADFGDRKMTPLIQWCENGDKAAWCHRPFVGARPLYRLHQLVTRPDAQVLVVEGEKCADAAQALLPSLAVTTWQGGGKAAGKSDWSPVSGRDVLIWPDADPEGLTAAHEAGRLATEAGARSVRVIEIPADKPKGWDIADAIEDGWTKADVVAFARAGARPWGEPRETPQTAPEPPAADSQRFDGPADEQGGEHDAVTSRQLNQQFQEKPQEEDEHKPAPREQRRRFPVVGGTEAGDPPSPHVIPDVEGLKEFDAHGRMKPKSFTNFVVMLQYHREMFGLFSFNEFTNQTILTRRPYWDNSKGEWTPRKLEDADVARARMWLERAQLNATDSDTHRAIDTAARALTFNPIREYLEGLKWDGVLRLFGDETRGGWLETYMGVKPTAGRIERAFGARWLIGIVARNLTENPDGEKMDTMLVVEGPQGMLKSTSVKSLASVAGGVYFVDGINDFTSDDAKLSMQGALIVEADEGLALKRGHADALKGALSKSSDKVRAPYGRYHALLRRRFGIVATLNPQGQGYLRDPTGARRFWPVRVEKPADIASLERDRDQLWAEAVAHYHAGEQWWLTDDEIPAAELEQRKRYRQDPLAGRIDEYLSTLSSHTLTVTVTQIFNVLGIPAMRYDPELFDRVVNHLVVRGWTKTQDRENPRADLFKRPQK